MKRENTGRIGIIIYLKKRGKKQKNIKKNIKEIITKQKSC